MIFRYPASTFSCVLIFSILITISSSSAQDDEYLDCSRQIECGDLRFGFPFRGPGRPSYCGLPEFNLTCRNRIPTISISGLSYRILEINNSSQILTLLQTDFDQNLCPSNPRNVTGVENLFNFTVETQFVDLYYGCSLPTSGILIPLDLGSFSCPNNRSQGGDFLPTESVLGRYEAAIRGWLAQCSKKVRVPVKLTAMESLQRDPTGARLTETIDGGFGMQWTSNDSLCSTCRFSGGQCGFNDTTSSFACFCDDQPYGTGCDSSAIAPTAAQPSNLTIFLGCL